MPESKSAKADLSPHELGLLERATKFVASELDRAGRLPTQDGLRRYLSCKDTSATRIRNYLITSGNPAIAQKLRDAVARASDTEVCVALGEDRGGLTGISFEQAAKKFRDFIGKKENRRVAGRASKDGPIGVFSDPHAPFVDHDKFGKAVRQAQRLGVCRAIVPGDLLDLFSFSRFAKFEHVPLKEEIAGGAAFLQVLSENFDSVEVIPGNHDDRAKKYFAKVLPSEFMFLVNHNVMRLAGEDLPNVSFPVMCAAGREIPFLWKSGDMILGHPETSSKLVLKPADTFANWLKEWQEPLGLGEIRVVGQGHTHRAAGPGIRADGIAIFELGCLCKIPEYAMHPKLMFHPQQNAWGYFVQRKGKTDLNESRLFFL